MIYRYAWWALFGVFVASGVMIGLVLLPVAVWPFLALVVVVATLTVVVGYEPGTERTNEGGHPVVRAVLCVLTACLTGTATVGLVPLLGVGAVLLGLLVGAGSPPAVAWYGRMLRTHATPVEPPQSFAVSTAQLCREWRESYEALNQAASSTARLRIVMARQRLLDELERRDPEGHRARG